MLFKNKWQVLIWFWNPTLLRNNDKVNLSSDQSLISPNNITVQSSIEGFENKRKDQRNQNNLILRQILPSSTKKRRNDVRRKISFSWSPTESAGELSEGRTGIHIIPNPKIRLAWLLLVCRWICFCLFVCLIWWSASCQGRIQDFF